MNSLVLSLCSGSVMRLRRVAVVVLVAVFCTWAGTAAAQPADTTETAKRKARAAAQSWLALVDDNAFGESWDEAAALLQERIKRADWVEKAGQLRDSIGALSSRIFTQASYRDSLSRAPSDGPFVLLKYRSTFGGKRLEELLLTVLDSRRDTTWRVAGYQVTPLRTSPP